VDNREVRDELPDDLDRGFVGAYTFPDNKRRKITGALYVVIAVAVASWSASVPDEPVLVNVGLLLGCAGLGLFGVYSIASGRAFGLDENEALVSASQAVGFPVGHASAQLGWRGYMSRPTWKMLVYSAEDPPVSRGLVLVDAIDGSIIDTYVEDNPEDWIRTAESDDDQGSSF
jgi:hypothetical protein|tara:strand:- start:2315 stop:2833 length:519 start_codon:yes stop_codon:yes gene_type:complete